MREVYLDESYIHQHYHKNDDSCWDPNDEQDIQVGKAPAKGNRYCFLCAIQGPNPRVFTPDDSENDRDARLLDKLKLDQLGMADRGGIVDGSVWAFCPQQKKQHKGDYHKVFNAENFVQWWKDQLLPNLTQPSLIIMDNASYHKTYVDKYPTSKWRKADYIAFCTRKEIPIESTDTIPIMAGKIREYKSRQKMHCVLLAEEQGHKVVFTPPHHSDLQPIELLWAKLKGNIGRKYDSNTTMAVLKERLDEEFDLACTWNESIEGFIHKTRRLARKFYTEAMEDIPEDGIIQDGDESTETASGSSDDEDVLEVEEL